MRKAFISAVGFLAGVATVGTAVKASAQTVPGYAADHFQPSERGSDFFATDSLDLQGDGRIALGLIGSYSYRALAFRDRGEVDALLQDQVLAHFGGAFFLHDRYRFAFNVPLSLYSNGNPVVRGPFTFSEPDDKVSVGDARLSFDARLFGKSDDPLTGAIGAQLFVPSGSQKGFTGWGDLRAHPRFMVAGRRGELQYASYLGILLSGRDENYNVGRVGNEFTAGASAGLRFLHDRLLVGPEIIAATTIERTFEKSTTPVEALLGGHYVAGDFRIGLAAGIGLSRGYGAPSSRGILSLEWVPSSPTTASESNGDRDGDGVPDGVDACLYVPGLTSTAPEKNGCPIPDFDKDGVADEDDICPCKPGSNPDPQRHGCPVDRDGDGIPDHDDACPWAPGQPNPDRSRNGCPQHKDSDHDGVPDFEDVCPYAPGMRTVDPRSSGCPTSPIPDRDQDGIWDHEDACPEIPGKNSTDPKKHGCPDVYITPDRINIADQVKFATASAVIENTKDNDRILSAVAKIMKEHTEIKGLRIEGHTDSQGDPAANVKLSEARAEAVVQWLVGHGIDRARLKANGVGADKPIAPNETEEGRASNRRIEFHIAEVGQNGSLPPASAKDVMEKAK